MKRKVNARVLHVRSVAEVQNKLDGRPAVFLSAGVPYERERPKGLSPEETERRVTENKQLSKRPHPKTRFGRPLCSSRKRSWTGACD
jgi:hypothetical protein